MTTWPCCQSEPREEIPTLGDISWALMSRGEGIFDAGLTFKELVGLIPHEKKAASGFFLIKKASYTIYKVVRV